MSHCPHHPAIELPDNLTCPLCAQEARRRAYALQRAEGSQTVRDTLQRLLRPATGAARGDVGDLYTQPSGATQPEG